MTAVCTTCLWDDTMCTKVACFGLGSLQLFNNFTSSSQENMSCSPERVRVCMQQHWWGERERSWCSIVHCIRDFIGFNRIDLGSASLHGSTDWEYAKGKVLMRRARVHSSHSTPCFSPSPCHGQSQFHTSQQQHAPASVLLFSHHAGKACKGNTAGLITYSHQIFPEIWETYTV